MDELFAVDAEARRKALSTAARHIRRQETAKPLLGDIRSKIEAAQSVALPSSALSKACQYALTLWRKLTRFLEYPELELSAPSARLLDRGSPRVRRSPDPAPSQILRPLRGSQRIHRRKRRVA